MTSIWTNAIWQDDLDEEMVVVALGRNKMEGQGGQVFVTLDSATLSGL